jgi:2-polyprenyl-3-methyl-5-hydroxy-6-metoxy-1,4-benzoquinol methylase
MENERILYTECPLCTSTDFTHLTNARATGHARWREPLEPFIVWMECRDCGHVFTNGYFTEAALGVLFQSTNNEQIVGTDIEFHRKISAKMVQRVIDAIGLPDDRLWLDVGFGNGSLLMTALEFGFTAFGIDLRKQNVEDLAPFGIPAYHGTLGSASESSSIPAKPTVISMADVVEHEPFPIDSLRSARALIQDDGVLLISMPNADAPLWHYWNSRHVNPYWIEIEHYHNFTRTRLYKILGEAGFTPIHYAISERYRGCMEVLAKAV